MKENENGRQRKSLVIECALCDATAVREEMLQLYDQVTVNAANVLVSPESAQLFHYYNVNINTASMMTVPAGTKVVTKNGKYTISKNCQPGETVALLVNGLLDIEPGAGEAMKNYAAIIVNGIVNYPESMAACVDGIQVNGTFEQYPDDAIRLKKSFVVDKVFVLRAKAGRYLASRRVIMSDVSLDVDGLVKKGVQFLTKTAFIAEPLLESALPLFGDEVDVIVIPEGCAFVNDDVTLDDNLLRQYGNKLYINGNLTIPDSAAGVLEKLAYLNVNGDVLIPSSLTDAWASVDAVCHELIIVRSVCFYDRDNIQIGREALETGDGVTLYDCAAVALDADIPASMIMEKLDIRGCAIVKCTPKQRHAVEMVCRDVAMIRDGSDEDSEKDGDLAEDQENEMSKGKKQVISAAYYQF